MEVKHADDLGALLASRGLLGAAADVGVAEGRTTINALQWGFRTVYAVDCWHDQEDVYRLCMDSLKPYGDRVVVLRGWSHDMAQRIPDESLDYLYIDAGHDYQSVKQDLRDYYPKVRSNVGAIVAGHDYSNPDYGVKEAVDEFVGQLGVELHVLPGGCDVDATFWFEKG
ncbi:MAG TPA: class I SAM-dependent methyltransferase [Marinobacter sp.]|uniref:Methyltransferase domain-containing protein n=1 Tax=marine sediment metagenome TaxID=412755 RepID=A0A0F9HKF2_9ZZZZ|nr:class I SAM-dependent methyltransferase [Marinobacter sp.]